LVTDTGVNGADPGSEDSDATVGEEAERLIFLNTLL
jgi:hypothetical protein